MSLTPCDPPGAAWPGVSAGVPGCGRGVFVTTGQVGTDADGKPVTISPEDQIVALSDNLHAVLAAAGLGFADVARLTAYVRSFDPEFMEAYRQVRSRHVNADCPPASVMIQAGLYDPRLLVEVEALAILP